ncbi:amino acid deaminase [Microbacterium sp. NPDC056044]|uniref:amino acid deaminase n=1 Tax=Microbacterium sp. NPDC056044 TaxID=3345690 RepID=UPI0035E1F337
MIPTLDDLDEAARRARHDPAGTLAAHDWLGVAIDVDAEAGRFASWGSSTVIDENTGGPVISPEVFAALHDRAGLDARWPVGNAGLLHVYGYLLSTVQTPYGLKRDRWLGGALAAAYGLPADAFVPWKGSSTLLSRVTDAATSLVSRATVRGPEPATGGLLALDRDGEQGPWALAYAVHGRLITTFPVASADTVLAEWDEAPARLRWNAAEPA